MYIAWSIFGNDVLDVAVVEWRWGGGEVLGPHHYMWYHYMWYKLSMYIPCTLLFILLYCKIVNFSKVNFIKYMHIKMQTLI